MTTAEKLAAPFRADQLGFKPQAVKGNRAMAVAYIDARDVQERLDEAVGVENWKDEFAPLPDGSVLCTLSVRLAGEWVAKQDVGSPSDQPDAGDRMKSAFSDALKRAAVKWGVGRYLYAMPHQWCDFDPAKKQFTQTPHVPPQFLPRPAKAADQAPPAADPALAARRLIEQTRTLKELAAVWESLPKPVQAQVEGLKNTKKLQIQEAAEVAGAK